MAVLKVEGGLGFKNLNKFNISLLAKQGWRLLDKPMSIIACMFQACYFNGKSFLEANLGANPSFCWRSILTGQVAFDKVVFAK